MPIVRNTDVAFVPGVVEGYRRRVLVNRDRGSGMITLGEAIVNPGSELPMHVHKVEEVMVIMEGTATAVLGEETHTLKPGDVVLAPAGEKHALGNRGNQQMRFIFFYPAVEVELHPV